MIKAIIYTSNTGTTAQYAKLLGEKTGLPVCSLSESSVPKDSEIIYLGWVMASSIKGYKKAARQYRVRVVCGVCMRAAGSQLAEVRKQNAVPVCTPVFTMQGGGQLFEFYLPWDMPHVCIGCYACINGNEENCGGYDALKPIISATEQSELIIFCSPTHVFHTPGQIKTLLDHFGYRWLVHRPDLSFLKKQAVIITTAGSGMKSTVRDIPDSLNYWGVARTHCITQAV